MILPKKRKIESVQQDSVSTNSILGHALVNQINIVDTSCHHYVIGQNQVQKSQRDYTKQRGYVLLLQM